MPDRYRSVADVLRHEAENVEIVARAIARSNVAILGLHAGDIEPLTGELAAAIAGRDHRLYLFAGTATSDNGRLHITSTRFDEPGLRRVLAGARTAVSIHGESGDRERFTLIGGLNGSLGRRIAAALDAQGFEVLDAGARLGGRSRRNAVNRVPNGGVQLELSRGLRNAMLDGDLNGRKNRADPQKWTPEFDRYVDAIRRVLENDTDGWLGLLRRCIDG